METTMNFKKGGEIFFIILFNIIPLIGCLFFQWELFNVLFYYWLETVVATLFALITAFATRAHGEKSINLSFKIAYSFLYLFIHGGIVLLIGTPILAFHPNESNGIIPNEILFDTFKNASGFFFATILLYTFKFISDKKSEKTARGSFNLHQKHLYFRVTILAITLGITALLFKFITAPAFVAVIIFTTLRIGTEILDQKRNF